MSSAAHNFADSGGDDHLDLVPLIDCVFLLLLFFILCGRISFDQRNETITVPPTKTSRVIPQDDKKTRIIINVFGKTQSEVPGKLPSSKFSVMVGTKTEEFVSVGPEDYSSYVRLRDVLDQQFAQAEKKPDEKDPHLQIPQVILEIRGDSETEWRVIQEIQQIATDTINPRDAMKAKTSPPKDRKPFIYIDFTSRWPNTTGK